MQRINNWTKDICVFENKNFVFLHEVNLSNNYCVPVKGKKAILPVPVVIV